MSNTPVESNMNSVPPGQQPGGMWGTDPNTGKQVYLPPNIDFAWLASQFTDWQNAAQELFGGYYEVIKENPELRQLIDDAIKNKWPPNQFQYKLEQTQWWKETSAANRQWIEEGVRDPATQKQNIANRVADLRASALERGVRLDDSALARLAEDSLKYGWNQQTISNAIGAEAVKSSGTISDLNRGYYGQTVQTIAGNFGVPLSKSTLDNWVSKIAAGQESEASFQSYVRDLSKNLYPALAGGFDRGLTFGQMTDPYAQVASNILEIPQAQIDFTDPKWAAAFTMRDSKGQQMQMSFGEWSDYLRTNPSFGYEYTDGAQQKAYQVANELARMFGAG